MDHGRLRWAITYPSWSNRLCYQCPRLGCSWSSHSPSSPTQTPCLRPSPALVTLIAWMGWSKTVDLLYLLVFRLVQVHQHDLGDPRSHLPSVLLLDQHHREKRFADIHTFEVRRVWRRRIMKKCVSSSGSQGIAFEAVLNAFPSVDSFFLMGGALTAYIVFKELDKAGSDVPRWRCPSSFDPKMGVFTGTWSPRSYTMSTDTSDWPSPTLSYSPLSSLSCPTWPMDHSGRLS